MSRVVVVELNLVTLDEEDSIDTIWAESTTHKYPTIALEEAISLADPVILNGVIVKCSDRSMIGRKVTPGKLVKLPRKG